MNYVNCYVPKTYDIGFDDPRAMSIDNRIWSRNKDIDLVLLAGYMLCRNTSDSLAYIKKGRTQRCLVYAIVLPEFKTYTRIQKKCINA